MTKKSNSVSTLISCTRFLACIPLNPACIFVAAFSTSGSSRSMSISSSSWFLQNKEYLNLIFITVSYPEVKANTSLVIMNVQFILVNDGKGNVKTAIFTIFTTNRGLLKEKLIENLFLFTKPEMALRVSFTPIKLQVLQYRWDYGCNMYMCSV